MKKLLLLSIWWISVFSGFCQTGPGGVGDDVTNRFWWDAYDYNGTGDGSAISTWNNKGGNVTNAVQNTAANRPVFRDAASETMNGYPVMQFDGNNDFFAIANNGDLNTAAAYERTFHIVIRTSNDINSRQVIYEEGAHIRGLNMYIFDGNLYMAAWNLANDGAGAPWGFYSFNTNIAINTEYVLTLRFEGNNTTTGTLTGFINGCQFGQSNNVGRLYSHTGAIGLGAKNATTYFETGRSNGTGNYFEGEIAEFIIYNYAESVGERTIIENYLLAKYGLASTCNDLYNEDDAAAGNFDHNISGIGQSSSGATNTAAKGEGVLQIGNPSDLNPNEYLIFGHNNDSLKFKELSNTSSLTKKRMDRIWSVSEVNESLNPVDVGTVDLEFDLTGADCVFSESSLVLLVDTNNDGNFTDETPITGAVNTSGNLFEFSSISQLSNNVRFTLAIKGPDITGDKEICEGESTTLSTSNGGSYNWNNGSTSSSINISPIVTTIYKVTITNASGCSAVSCDTVVVKPLPDPGANQVFSCPAGGGMASSTYNFNLAGTWVVNSEPSGASAIVTNTGMVSGMSFSGTYTFQVTIDGCSETVSITVPVCCSVPQCIPLSIQIVSSN